MDQVQIQVTQAKIFQRRFTRWYNALLFVKIIPELQETYVKLVVVEAYIKTEQKVCHVSVFVSPDLQCVTILPLS